MDPVINTPAWLDKGLWTAILTPVLLVIGSHFGVNLNAAEIVGIVFPIVTYIIMHKWKATTITTTMINAAALKSATNTIQTVQSAAASLSGK